MKLSHTMRTILILLLSSTACLAQYVPFDKFYKENVSMTVDAQSGGASTRNDYVTDFGSYDKTKNQQWTMRVSVNTRTPATVEFFFISKEKGKEIIAPCEPIKVSGAAPVFFSETAESKDTRYAALGIHETSGKKLYGWIARVVCDGRVVSAEGSTDRFKTLAASGAKIEATKK